jgi:hypothetical protein
MSTPFTEIRSLIVQSALARLLDALDAPEMSADSNSLNCEPIANVEQIGKTSSPETAPTTGEMS